MGTVLRTERHTSPSTGCWVWKLTPRLPRPSCFR